MWRPSWIFAFCVFSANYLQGCSPRLCLWVVHRPTFYSTPCPSKPSGSLCILLKLCHFQRFWQPSWICHKTYVPLNIFKHTLIVMFSNAHSEKIRLETIAICVGCITHSEHDLAVPFQFNLTLNFTPTTQICPQSIK